MLYVFMSFDGMILQSASALSIQNGADVGGVLASKAEAMVNTLAAAQAAWTSAGQVSDSPH